MEFPKNVLPPGFEDFVETLLSEVESIEGYLSPTEIRFLALLAAVRTADGEILEIGSFKGKSTIVLTKAASLLEKTVVHAVDPMIAPSITDPDLNGDPSSLPDFQKNISAHDLEDQIRLHQNFSFELAETWDKPLRLLWIDGDHTYRGTKQDFDGFSKHLSDGAIVAMHDVLHEFEGGLRVFMEDVLLSPNFAACGFVGSIAWGQFHNDDKKSKRFQAQKLKYYKQLARLVPYVVFREKLEGFEKMKYKLFRSRLPRAPMKPAEWLAMID